MSIKQVQISTTQQGAPAVDISTVDLWLPDGDQVQWLGTGPYEVSFPSGSPFASSSFNCPSGSSTPLSSGPIKTGSTGPYKYNVQIGSKILDPTIKIHP